MQHDPARGAGARRSPSSRPSAARGIVLDAATGEILAMVSLPDFDPERTRQRPRPRRCSTAHARRLRDGLDLQDLYDGDGARLAAVTLDSAATTPAIRSRSAASRSPTTTRKNRCAVGARDLHVLVEHRLGPDGAGRRRRASARLPRPARHAASRRASSCRSCGEPHAPAAWRTGQRMTIAFGHGHLGHPAAHRAAGVSAMVNGGRCIPPTLVKRDPGPRSTAASGDLARTPPTRCAS